MKIWIFAAHSDDTSACLGGTIARLTQIPEVQIRSTICMPANRDTVSREIRVAEGIEEHRRLGIKAEFLEFYNGELDITPKTRERFALMIREWRPDLVLTHDPRDDHPDHQVVGLLAMKPGLERGATHETILFEAWRGVRQPQTVGFIPDHIVDISGEPAEKKYHAIDAHVSQNEVYRKRPEVGENISDFYQKIDSIAGFLCFSSLERRVERFCRITRGPALQGALAELFTRWPHCESVRESLS